LGDEDKANFLFSIMHLEELSRPKAAGGMQIDELTTAV
jgi:hypothetical protein